MNDDPHKLRPAVEEYVRKSFESQDIVALTRENAPSNLQQKRPRVEIKCAIGPATGRKFLCPDNIMRYDAFRFDLGIQVVTNPTAAGQNSQHETFVARVKTFASSLGGQPTMDDVANFPNHYIAQPLTGSGDQADISKDADCEYSTISFAGVICVRQSAWS